MTTRELTEKLLRAYSAYYNVERETPAPPFAAEAVFHSHSEQYFLIKSARLAETESNEYVFFAEEERLDEARLRALAESAWQEGTSRVQPAGGAGPGSPAEILPQLSLGAPGVEPFSLDCCGDRHRAHGL